MRYMTIEDARVKICPVMTTGIGDRLCKVDQCMWWEYSQIQRMSSSSGKAAGILTDKTRGRCGHG